MTSSVGKWPKRIPQLSKEQQRATDDWMHYWHEINKTKFSPTIEFGHRYVMHHSPLRGRTLEVGAGFGEQLAYEKLGPEELDNYVSVELRENMANTFRKAWPGAKAIVGDCQQPLDFPDGSFDRVTAIHVLEHLPHLPAFLREAKRLLKPRTGRLMVVIPCEGGLGYSLGRRITSQRMFEKRYGIAYAPVIAAEHVNTAAEVIEELRAVFHIEHSRWFPLRIPMVDANLVVGMRCRPR